MSCWTTWAKPDDGLKSGWPSVEVQTAMMGCQTLEFLTVSVSYELHVLGKQRTMPYLFPLEKAGWDEQVPRGLCCLVDNSGVHGFTWALTMPTIIFKIC